MPDNISSQLKNTSLYIFYGLLAYMPLHIFISTILGVQLGFLDFAKVFKDTLLFFGFGVIFLTSIKEPWFNKWLKNPLVLFISAYALTTLITALLKMTDQDAETLGIVYNLRFLLFFLYGWLFVKILKEKKLKEIATKIVLSVGVLVVTFGLFQYFILPNDALTNLGFVRENGVLP
ncbi:hypothetical protein KC950_03480, partial [Candidatus Saccharibacteria bacterium]|nr:hypothetical protein [Candidatus Saccharibacteria bacterium]